MSRYKLCTLPTPSSSSGAIKARPVIGDRSERLNRHVGSRSDGLRPSQFFSLLLGMGNEVGLSKTRCLSPATRTPHTTGHSSTRTSAMACKTRVARERADSRGKFRSFCRVRTASSLGAFPQARSEGVPPRASPPAQTADYVVGQTAEVLHRREFGEVRSAGRGEVEVLLPEPRFAFELSCCWQDPAAAASDPGRATVGGCFRQRLDGSLGTDAGSRDSWPAISGNYPDKPRYSGSEAIIWRRLAARHRRCHSRPLQTD